MPFLVCGCDWFWFVVWWAGVVLLDAVVDFGFRDSLAVVIVVTGFVKIAV